MKKTALANLMRFLLFLLMAAAIAQAVSADNITHDGKTVIVAAHGDDEILWMDPFLARAKEIIWVGHAFEQTRKDAVIRIFQTDMVYGRRIPLRWAFPAISDQQRVDEARAQCYRDLILYNKREASDALWPLLVRAKYSGAARIVTHNPWGEYGHPHHRMLSAIATQMAHSLDMDVWYPALIKTSGADGQYLEADFLDSVEYSDSFTWSDSFYMARQILTDARLTVPPYSSLFTWESDTYPAWPQRFWKAPRHATQAYKNQIEKIMGETPNKDTDIPGDYVVPPFYVCRDPCSKS